MASGTQRAGQPATSSRPGRTAPRARTCPVCDERLSSYNPGPNCYRHTVGIPWRGPTAKPKH